MTRLSRVEPCLAVLVTLLGSTSASAQTNVTLDEISVAGSAGGGSGGGNSGSGPATGFTSTTGYVARETTTGSKTRIPVVEIPQSVTTVTRAQLNEPSRRGNDAARLRSAAS